MNNFDLSNLNLNLLPALQALLTEKNVTLAGEKLNLSQSAMSHCLKQLRSHFNDRLLVKGKNNILTLTPLAESLIQLSQNACMEVQKVFDSCNKFIPDQMQTQFNIGMPDYISMVFFPKLMKRLWKITKKVRIVIHSLNHIKTFAQFEELKLDFAIGMYTNPPQELIRQYLFSDKAVCVACANNKKISTPWSLQEFLRHPQALIAYQPNEESVYIKDIIKKMGGKLDIVAIVPYISALIHLIPNSPFVTIVLEQIARQYVMLFNLKIYPLPFSLKPYRASLYWHEKNRNSEKHAWLRKIILEVAET